MQHINLCSQLDRVVEPPFSARQQLWFVAAVFVVMLCAYLLITASVSSGVKELNDLHGQQQSLAAQVDSLKAKKQQLQQDKGLQQEIAQLKKDIQFRRQLLATVDPEATRGQNFSEHLVGLARQHVDGLWFTEIQLQEGGQQLALLGRTRQAEYLPRYLQKLTAEDVFSGHQFRVLRMNVLEDRTDLLDFELRSNESGEVRER